MAKDGPLSRSIARNQFAKGRFARRRAALGSTLLLRVRELRLSLRDVMREVKEVSEGRIAQLRIGASVATSEGLLVCVMNRLLDDAPRTMFNVIVSDNDLLIPALRNGELDAVVNFLPVTVDGAGLVQEPLYTDEDLVCVSANHRFAGRKTVTLRDLAEERWVVPELTLLPAQRLFGAFRKAMLPPPAIALQSRSATLRLRLAASSGLVDLSFRSVVNRVGAEFSIATLPVKELTRPHPVCLLYRHQAYRSAAMQRFIEIAKSVAKTNFT